jgi:hypothetical protein
VQHLHCGIGNIHKPTITFILHPLGMDELEMTAKQTTEKWTKWIMIYIYKETNTKMTEQVVTDPSEVVQQYTPCEELRQQKRRTIATPRGNNTLNGSNALKNGIHIGVIDQKTYCNLSENAKTPMCQRKTKIVGNSDRQEILKYQRHRERWTSRQSVENSLNQQRMRRDQQHRSACAVTVAHLRESEPIAMTNNK